MTAAMVEDDSSSKFCPWEYLLETWRELDVPEGWRAEIDEARIFLVPPPHAHHNGLVPIYLLIDRFDPWPCGDAVHRAQRGWYVQALRAGAVR